MPISAPDQANRTYRSLSWRFIDASGDKRGESLRVANNITPAQAYALVEAIAEASLANVYEWSLSDVYAVLPNADVAENGSRSESVFDNVVLLLKRLDTGQALNVFIPAPKEALFSQGSDNIEQFNPLFQDVVGALQNAIGAGWTLISVRYSERREVNTAQPYRPTTP